MIFGKLEQIAGNLLLGWARPESDNGPVTVAVSLSGTLVGVGDTTEWRPDLGGNFGFRITCVARIPETSLLTNQLELTARVGDDTNVLEPTSKAVSSAIAYIIADRMSAADSSDIDIVVAALSGLPTMSSDRDKHLVVMPARQEMVKKLSPLGYVAREPGDITSLANLSVGVGHISPDGSAIIGHNGHAFLIGGGNDVLDQFLLSVDAPMVVRAAADWVIAVRARAESLSALGCRYLQIFIPEKLTVLPEAFPATVTTPSALFATIASALAREVARAEVLFAFSETPKSFPPALVFPRLDSHLTTDANFFLFAKILRCMMLENPFQSEIGGKELLVGDLAERFFGVPLYEECERQDSARPQWASLNPLLLERVDPEEGHVGSRYVWKNEQAPLDIKVVVFGNSFFERGSIRGLSWWCCRAFREFHFIWSADLDVEYVRRHNPNWVICQTIERFLFRLPQDDR